MTSTTKSLKHMPNIVIQSTADDRLDLTANDMCHSVLNSDPAAFGNNV